MMFVQDTALGVFMATLPILAGHADKRSHSFAHVPSNSVMHSWLHGTFGGVYFLFIYTTTFGNNATNHSCTKL